MPQGPILIAVLLLIVGVLLAISSARRNPSPRPHNNSGMPMLAFVLLMLTGSAVLVWLLPMVLRWVTR